MSRITDFDPDKTILRIPTLRLSNTQIDQLKQGLIKVPELTVFFWIVKLLTTALGESTSDYLVHKLDPVVAVMIGAIGFAIVITVQFFVRRYFAPIYWAAVIMVAVFGTMGADVVHIVLGVPYWASTIFFAVSLAIVFLIWYGSEKTLSIHSIYTLRREFFYWSTIIVTFALGTAAGDLTAYTFHLGFFTSLLLFLVLMAIPIIGYWLFGLNAIAAFWFAYILTRPIGASFADWTGKSGSAGGLGLGSGHVGIVLGIIIIGFVSYLTITRRDVQDM